MTLDEALRQAADCFIDSDSADLDARLLLAHVLQVPVNRFYSHPEQQLGEAEAAIYRALCERRAAGEPVAYLLGSKGFWNLELEVSPAVLIPRPETELLVELALQLAEKPAMSVADLGTGSGAIALALASEKPQWQVWATELQPAAMAVAQRNLRRAALDNVSLVQGSWCEPLPDLGFDLLLANPPYIAQSDPHLSQGDLRFEPRSALVAEQEGLADIRAISIQALPRLAIGGWLLLEHGWQQGPAVREILSRAGYTGINTATDLAGLDRVTMGRKQAYSEVH